MRRLSVIDVVGGHQPIHSEDGAVSAVCNGEIYNYRELREELLSRGHILKSRSDSEVIVHLYEEDPDAFVHKLRGMFAVALYDSKRERLLLARDRIGIKPIYYTFQGGCLVFASELKAIMEYPDLEKKVSLKAVSDYLTFLYIPAPDTIFEDIHKLPPGHTLTFEKGRLSIRKYWEIDYKKGKEEGEGYYIEKLEGLLKETVKMHLESEVPLGAFLSGGVDSSTIVALMSGLSGSPVKTFSVGFDVADFNELGYARAVADMYGTEHHEINLNPDIVKLLPRIVRQHDEPFADSSSIPTYLLSEFAKRHVTVCLAGDGGDELFAGYGWTRRQRFIEDYKRIPGAVRALVKKALIGGDFSPDRKNSPFDKIRRFVYDAEQPLEKSCARRMTCFSGQMKKALFSEEAYRGVKDHDSASRISPFLRNDGIESEMERLLYLDTKMYLPDDGLCKVDRMSMAHSLEVRVPFLDHKVVEFAASMPFRYKMRGFSSKYAVKKMMKGRLPEKIIRQRKLGFSIPLEKWFRGRLKEEARKELLSGESATRRLFKSQNVEWIIGEHARARQDFGNQIFALLVLELWLKENSYDTLG